MGDMGRQVSLWCVVAITLWVVTFLFILAGTIVGMTFADDGRRGLAVSMSLLTHGLAAAVAAATVTIRNLLSRQNYLLRQAFDLGRDIASTHPVHRLHRNDRV